MSSTTAAWRCQSVEMSRSSIVPPSLLQSSPAPPDRKCNPIIGMTQEAENPFISRKIAKKNRQSTGPVSVDRRRDSIELVTRALVLGGGGAVGIGWQAGLITGLADEGVALRGADVVVGTSAGSVVGAQLTSDRALADVVTHFSHAPPWMSSDVLAESPDLSEMFASAASDTVSEEEYVAEFAFPEWYIVARDLPLYRRRRRFRALRRVGSGGRCRGSPGSGIELLVARPRAAGHHCRRALHRRRRP